VTKLTVAPSESDGTQTAQNDRRRKLKWLWLESASSCLR